MFTGVWFVSSYTLVRCGRAIHSDVTPLSQMWFDVVITLTIVKGPDRLVWRGNFYGKGHAGMPADLYSERLCRADGVTSINGWQPMAGYYRRTEVTVRVSRVGVG